MSYFHTRLSIAGERHDEVKLDLAPAQLESQFLAPYREGRHITVNGRTVHASSITRLRVSASAVPSSVLIREIEREDRGSPVLFAGGPTVEWRAADRAEDVTDEHVGGPPGGSEGSGGNGARSDPGVRHRVDGRSVFLVHGRDAAIVEAMHQFLRSLGLRVIEWPHAVRRTGVPNPYVGEVVARGFEMSDAVVILFTPDVLVRLRGDLLDDADGPDESEVRGQARPNVYYEAGIADGIDRNRTLLVEVGRVKSFSDVSGRLLVRFDGSAAKRKTLADRLASTGLEVDTVGGGWLSAGDFQPAIEAANKAVSDALEIGGEGG
ncbi:TIR domain-containing protein [Saccharothrix australiensis]|uniref:Putative nucleotide-binding protein n=1 Tax=Saccharothrix australiensis TaxID=2072 RepID=A0A495W7H4_9PSEU|nr:nucleotide-binding protein [Saccharothrix australiensis]RKT57622.1 putative nucleotide-binding protein [Saccharothrix australiensis]